MLQILHVSTSNLDNHVGSIGPREHYRRQGPTKRTLAEVDEDDEHEEEKATLIANKRQKRSGAPTLDEAIDVAIDTATVTLSHLDSMNTNARGLRPSTLSTHSPRLNTEDRPSNIGQKSHMQVAKGKFGMRRMPKAKGGLYKSSTLLDTPPPLYHPPYLAHRLHSKTSLPR